MPDVQDSIRDRLPKTKHRMNRPIIVITGYQLLLSIVSIALIAGALASIGYTEGRRNGIKEASQAYRTAINEVLEEFKSGK